MNIEQAIQRLTKMKESYREVESGEYKDYEDTPVSDLDSVTGVIPAVSLDSVLK